MTTHTIPEPGVPLDLARIQRELRDDQLYVRVGQTARTLVRAPDLRVVIVALAAGKTLSEHHANVSASVQTLSGQIQLQLPERRVSVPAGHVLLLGPTVPHDVYAETDSTFLITLGWPATDAPAES